MKAITLHQPWATLIAIGAKKIETRSWQTYYRGPLVIHAGLTTDVNEFARLLAYEDVYKVALSDHVDLGLPYAGLSRGAVVATARLIECVPMVGAEDPRPARSGSYLADLPNDGVHEAGWWLLGYNGFTKGSPTRLSDEEVAFGDYQPGRWAWLLEDVEPLEEPIPAKGRQGLWNWEGE